jgi:bifunctional enzyme CysN/CysC
MRSPVQSAAVDAERAGGAGMAPALRLLVCGARGSGKSALIARLLDSRPAAPASSGSIGAWSRAFIVADAPGGDQYTLAMATGAMNAQVAVLLVDASQGLLAETRRDTIIAGLSGIKHVVLAVNKIDLVAFGRDSFSNICANFRSFAGELDLKSVTCIPLSARDGDNVAARSTRTPWYEGPSLLEFLETVEAEDHLAAKPFRMPVKSANTSTGRAFAGTVVSGSLRPGDRIAVLPAGHTAIVDSLAGSVGDLGAAQAGDAVTVTLAAPVEAAPGDMLAALRDRPQVADQFAAHLVWLSANHLLPERSYTIKINDAVMTATVTNLKHRIDVNSLAKLAAKTLGPDDVGMCNLSVAQPVAFDPYADNRGTGAFILLDRESNDTVAVGMIAFALRRATNIHHQAITISKAERAALMRHRPAVLWFTGLSGAGKSTVANLVEDALHARGVHTLILDGDNIRHGLNRDLGFTEVDRVENIRRVGEVAKLMTEAGLIVLCSFISPFRAERRMVRELLDKNEFIEIFVDTPLEECIARDPKGLYRRALAGEIKNFTGVDQDYEVPENPELRLQAGTTDAGRLADEVIGDLIRRKII